MGTSTTNCAPCLHEISCMLELNWSHNLLNTMLEGAQPLDDVDHHNSTSKEVLHYKRSWILDIFTLLLLVYETNLQAWVQYGVQNKFHSRMFEVS